MYAIDVVRPPNRWLRIVALMLMKSVAFARWYSNNGPHCCSTCNGTKKIQIVFARNAIEYLWQKQNVSDTFTLPIRKPLHAINASDTFRIGHSLMLTSAVPIENQRTPTRNESLIHQIHQRPDGIYLNRLHHSPQLIGVTVIPIEHINTARQTNEIHPTKQYNWNEHNNEMYINHFSTFQHIFYRLLHIFGLWSSSIPTVTDKSFHEELYISNVIVLVSSNLSIENQQMLISIPIRNLYISNNGLVCAILMLVLVTWNQTSYRDID